MEALSVKLISPYCKDRAQDIDGYDCIERIENNFNGCDEI